MPKPVLLVQPRHPRLSSIRAVGRPCFLPLQASSPGTIGSFTADGSANGWTQTLIGGLTGSGSVPMPPCAAGDFFMSIFRQAIEHWTSVPVRFNRVAVDIIPGRSLGGPHILPV